MKEPRNPDVIIQEINELNHLIEHTQATLRQFPDDKLLQVALQQDLHRKKNLAKELHLSLSLYLYQFG
jgi:hypothetical protein